MLIAVLIMTSCRKSVTEKSIDDINAEHYKGKIVWQTADGFILQGVQTTIFILDLKEDRLHFDNEVEVIYTKHGLIISDEEAKKYSCFVNNDDESRVIFKKLRESLPADCNFVEIPGSMRIKS